MKDKEHAAHPLANSENALSIIFNSRQLRQRTPTNSSRPARARSGSTEPQVLGLPSGVQPRPSSREGAA